MDKKEEKNESMYEFIKRTLDEAFVDNIPMDSIKELPRFYMYLFGAFAELFSAAVFVYFIYSVYVQGRNSKFISITTSSGECTDITKSVSGTFTADVNGTWNGFPDYIYTRGIYSVTFAEAKIGLSTYQQVMTSAREELDVLAAQSVNNNLAQNLLTYTSWVFNCNPEIDSFCVEWIGQSFTFTATAQYMFSLEFVETTISNVYADCTALSMSNYDLANSLNTGTYNYADFADDPTCNTTVDPMNLGYDPSLNGPEFVLSMDVRTFIDSIAANFNTLPLTAWPKVDDTPVFTFYHNNYTYTGTYYTDELYIGMRPMFCITNDDPNPNPLNSVPQLCFLSYGNISGVPLYLHYGAGNGVDYPVQPMPCNCDEPYAVGAGNACDEFDLMTGFLFFDVGLSPENVVNTWLDLIIRAGGAQNLNDLAYNASFAAAASKYPDADPIITDPAWRRSAYDFCFVDGIGYCSVFVINSYGNGIFDKAITPSIFLLNDGSCASEFTIPQAAFDKLINQPPTPIVEDYYQCVLTPGNALINAAGIASGNVSLIVPVVMFALLPLMYLWLTASGNVQPKPEYEKLEIQAALECLALQILRVRDNKARGIKKQGYLMNISEELTVAALNADGTAVDSDDSDEEDDKDNPTVDRSKAGKARRKSSNTDALEKGDSFQSIKRQQSGLKRQASRRASNNPQQRRKSYNSRELKFLKKDAQDSDDEEDANPNTSSSSPFHSNANSSTTGTAPDGGGSGEHMQSWMKWVSSGKQTTAPQPKPDDLHEI